MNEQNSFHNFLKYSETRWLTRANVIKVVLEQWVAGYFAIIVNSEKSYMAKTLHNMFNDNCLYIYLVSTYCVSLDVNRVNILFQHDNAEVYLELYQLLLNSMRRVIKPHFLETLQDMSVANFKKSSVILDNDLAL